MPFLGGFFFPDAAPMIIIQSFSQEKNITTTTGMIQGTTTAGAESAGPLFFS